VHKHELSHDTAILLGAHVLVDDRLDLPAESELVCTDVVEKKVLIGVNKPVCERMEGSATRRAAACSASSVSFSSRCAHDTTKSPFSRRYSSSDSTVENREWYSASAFRKSDVNSSR